MKSILNFFCILILAIALKACEKDTTLRVEKKAPKLVIYGLTAAEQPFEVFVSKSASVLDVVERIRDLDVTDAKVYLHADGVLTDSFKYNGPYQSYTTMHGSTAKPGIRYRLTASASGLANVEAEAFLQNDFPELRGSTMLRNPKKIDGTETFEVRIRFADPKGAQNYYIMRILTPFYTGSDVSYYTSSGCFYTNDPDVDDNAGIDPLVSGCISNELFINDRNFDGRQKELVLNVPVTQLTVVQDPANGRTYRPLVQITNITGDYYKYRRSIEQYNMAADNPFAEPVSIFTNIRNGFGIFGVSRPQIDTIR